MHGRSVLIRLMRKCPKRKCPNCNKKSVIGYKGRFECLNCYHYWEESNETGRKATR